MKIGRLPVVMLLLFSAGAMAQQVTEDQAVAWLQSFVRIDTVNPPGNEYRAVEFYKAIFDAEGIEYQTAESAPGRGNIWARLPGGDEPGLILLQHTDVVPADREFWSFDPLSGDISDGYIYGRGTRDMKGLGIAQLVTFINLHRAGLPLNRDVIFLATADEEAGGEFGVGWLIDNHPEIFEGAGILLNEGGGGSRIEDDVTFGVEVTQKVPVWLRLEAVDVPGHGSAPRTSSAVTRIVRALNTMLENPFPPRVIAPVQEYFAGLSLNMGPTWQAAYADLNSAINDPDFLQRLHEQRPGHHALTRDTCSMTRFEASNKINVVPPTAWAEIDCRILPDKPAEQFVSELEALIADTGVSVEVIMAFTPAISTTNSRLFEAIRNVTAELHPGSRVLPSVSTGFTDSHFTRDLGIISYGFNPMITDDGEHTGVHGNDERVPEAVFRRGVSDFYAVVRNVVYD
ncbi:M20/M25/M40 family metallo-hydrolase [Pseudohongiella spirulinae]|uniref:Putative peptidase family M20/M25/M40 n=1 Tax=Pseudohongiella spirulinae TaxID=1249552 RepID=A0A0S2KDP3_9GAMM|nr:M20/M25/M40 family metallo-hydrolase [Pseudohongiella spirulinae]ALO46196.1 Putative peptidase family M20/M25/M40 [Pseudohongiella spirulinae]